MRDLRGIHLLIVEDEWLLASDLAKFFADMGAVILGPVATVEQAARHTQAAEAAILDIDLRGRRVFPIADELVRRNVPFVFFSGYDDIAIPDRLRYASNLKKSSTPADISDVLFPPTRPPEDNIISLLPKLRLAARLLLDDVGASDRLVERTLLQAIEEVDSRPADLTTARWLNLIMRGIARLDGASLMH